MTDTHWPPLVQASLMLAAVAVLVLVVWWFTRPAQPERQWYRCPDCGNVQDLSSFCDACEGPRTLRPVDDPEQSWSPPHPMQRRRRP